MEHRLPPDRTRTRAASFAGCPGADEADLRACTSSIADGTHGRDRLIAPTLGSRTDFTRREPGRRMARRIAYSDRPTDTRARSPAVHVLTIDAGTVSRSATVRLRLVARRHAPGSRRWPGLVARRRRVAPRERHRTVIGRPRRRSPMHESPPSDPSGGRRSLPVDRRDAPEVPVRLRVAEHCSDWRAHARWAARWQESVLRGRPKCETGNRRAAAPSG